MATEIILSRNSHSVKKYFWPNSRFANTTSATAAALPEIIDSLRAQGYQFVTISQMLEHLHAKRPAVPRILSQNAHLTKILLDR